MKQSPALQRIQETMTFGSLAAHGFLGRDTRSLTDIINDDALTVDRLGLSHIQIADRMDYFTSHASKRFGEAISVDGVYRVIYEEHKGRLPCPFADNVAAAKSIISVTNTENQLSLRWSALNVHMIRAHGFYEGLGARFRVDPTQAARVLGLL